SPLRHPRRAALGRLLAPRATRRRGRPPHSVRALRLYSRANRVVTRPLSRGYAMESDSGPSRAADTLVATTELLRRAKGRDRAALDALAARYLPRLKSWASGRLPMRARSLLDTADLVQETLLRTLERLDQIEVRGPGGFQAYVRSAVLNRIRDQI